MKRRTNNIISILVVGSLLVFLFAGTVKADVYYSNYSATIDLSSLADSDFELEIALYDYSGFIGDSYVLIDNVVFGTVVEDFESGIGGFDGDPSSSVKVVDGKLRMDEFDPIWPTLAWRDYTGSSTVSTLSFDFEMYASSAEGFFGWYDEFVVSILDADLYAHPLLPYSLPFPYQEGEVMAVSSAGISHTDFVTVVPVPGAVLLSCIGMGMSAMRLRRKRG